MTIPELEEMEKTVKRGLAVIEASEDESAKRAGKAVHKELTDLRRSFPEWPEVVPEGGGGTGK